MVRCVGDWRRQVLETCSYVSVISLRSRRLSLSLSLYLCVCVCVCVFVRIPGSNVIHKHYRITTLRQQLALM